MAGFFFSVVNYGVIYPLLVYRDSGKQQLFVFSIDFSLFRGILYIGKELLTERNRSVA